MDREARLASVQVPDAVCLVSLSPLSGQAGREDRKQYGFKKRKKSLFSSSTNREKDRNKNFLMVRQKRGVRVQEETIV